MIINNYIICMYVCYICIHKYVALDYCSVAWLLGCLLYTGDVYMNKVLKKIAYKNMYIREMSICM